MSSDAPCGCVPSVVFGAVHDFADGAGNTMRLGRVRMRCKHRVLVVCVPPWASAEMFARMEWDTLARGGW